MNTPFDVHPKRFGSTSVSLRKSEPSSSGDLERAWSLAEQIEAGAVGVNVNGASELQAPFGGWKMSGLKACLPKVGTGFGIKTCAKSRS